MLAHVGAMVEGGVSYSREYRQSQGVFPKVGDFITGFSRMNRCLPGRWGGEGHFRKRKEHVHRLVLNALQVVHRGGRIGDTAGEMGGDVRGLERHSEQLLSGVPAGKETHPCSAFSPLGSQLAVSEQRRHRSCPRGVYSLFTQPGE